MINSKCIINTVKDLEYGDINFHTLWFGILKVAYYETTSTFTKFLVALINNISKLSCIVNFECKFPLPTYIGGLGECISRFFVGAKSNCVCVCVCVCMSVQVCVTEEGGGGEVEYVTDFYVTGAITFFFTNLGTGWLRTVANKRTRATF